MEQLSQHILDLARNSLEAGAGKIEITIREDTEANLLEFNIRDNGHGIAPEDIAKVQDPFYSTKPRRRFGLGIPLLKDAVETCKGIFIIDGNPDEGTSITATFPHNHPDRAPLGDIAETLSVLITGSKPLHLIYRHHCNGKKFVFDTKEIESLLGDIPLQTPEVLLWLNEYIGQKIEEVRKIEKLGRTG